MLCCSHAIQHWDRHQLWLLSTPDSVGFPKFPSSPAELSLLLQLYLMGLWFFMRHLDWVMLVKSPLQSGKCHCLALPFHIRIQTLLIEQRIHSCNSSRSPNHSAGLAQRFEMLHGCCSPWEMCPLPPPVCTVRPSVVINGQRADCFNPACQLCECAAPPFLCQERIRVLDGAWGIGLFSCEDRICKLKEEC